jgi:uncharacterized OB-fold protein
MTCLFKDATLHTKGAYTTLTLNFIGPEGIALPLRIFSPSTNKKNKEKLQSLADAVGAESFHSKEEGRILSMILDKVKPGYPVEVVWRYKKWMNGEGEDIDIVELLRFEKFEGVVIDGRNRKS